MSRPLRFALLGALAGVAIALAAWLTGGMPNTGQGLVGKIVYMAAFCLMPMGFSASAGLLLGLLRRRAKG